MKKFKIGVIGAGRIGKIHAENVVYQIPEGEVIAVADTMLTDQVKNWATSLGIQQVTSNYKEVLANKEIDAVLICSSTDTHAQFSIEAARAGKHIFCEKPVDQDLRRIEEVISEVKKAGVYFQVGFNRRFDHNFQAVKNAILDNKIGQPHLIKITSRDPEPPPVEYIKVSGGLFLDMTIHDFDMARFLSGSEVEEVYATGAALVDPAIGQAGDIDTALITLKFKNQAMGVIDNSRKAAYGYDQRVEVFGSAGAIEVSNDLPSTAKISTAQGVTGEKPLYFFLERYMQSFQTEMIDFFEVLKNNQKESVDYTAGLESVRIALAAKKSLQENRPVKLAEIQ
ncbi:MAG: inositol 2-dehydrogenase [Spirochaetes bacterium]|nr:inositol 2-dehydrogenase [Spirochaetota bacterium]